MKLRSGFVSNSSSSAFIVKKKDLTEDQIDKIKNHIKESKKFFDKDGNCAFYNSKNDEWSIEETEENLEGSTYMDNFDFKSFMEEIGVDVEKVDFDDDMFW